MLVCVRSIREGNFDMYVESLTQTVSFFFLRWIIHITTDGCRYISAT